MNNYSFDLHTSTNWQNCLMESLRLEGHTVIDKSDDRQAQANGYDFLLDGESSEFKYDTQMSATGNVAVEIISNIRRAVAGWFITSRAHWLFYLDTKSKICYQIDLLKLRIALDSDTRKRHQAGKAQTEGKYSTLSWLVELGYIRNSGCILKEIQL